MNLRSKFIESLFKKDGNIPWLSNLIEELIAELDINHQQRTARAYRSMLNSFIEFNHNQDIPVNKIDNVLVKRFEMYLKNKNKSLNTISFYMRNLRAVYNKAIKMRIIARPDYNPFDNVYTGIEKTSKRAIKKNTINKLFELDLDFDKNVNKAKHLFIFSFCARGMSFIDMAFLKKTDIEGGFIKYRRSKTKQLLEIKITDEIAKIISIYKDEMKESKYILPIIENHKADERLQYESALRTYNNRLQRISRIMNLNIPLTSYVTRHSWATIAKSKNIPLSIISEGLGHNSQQTTQIYLASFDNLTLHKANLKVISK